MRDAEWFVYFETTAEMTAAMEVGLRVAFAGVVRCGLLLQLNGRQIAAWEDLKAWADNSVYRDGSRGQYTQKEVNVSVALLAKEGGNNTLSFTTQCPTEMVSREAHSAASHSSPCARG